MRASWVLTGLLMIGLAGCAHTVAVPASMAPAAEVSPGRRIAAAAKYDFAPDIQSLNRRVHPIGLQGSAHYYDVNLASPLIATLSAAINEAFTKSNPLVAGAPVAYRFDFSLEDAGIRIAFAPGFFVATAVADVNITVRVRVLNGAGAEISRALITGHGEASQDGGAETMEHVIAMAGERALRKIGDDFVYKVINSGQITAPRS
jgi:hypothetical protein